LTAIDMTASKSIIPTLQHKSRKEIFTTAEIDSQTDNLPATLLTTHALPVYASAIPTMRGAAAP